MSEIFDLIIELIGTFKGSHRTYKHEFECAAIMSHEEQKIVYDCFCEHVSKDPSTARLSYSYLLVTLRKKSMKVVALDDRLNKVLSVVFKPRFTAEWKTGRTDRLYDANHS